MMTTIDNVGLLAAKIYNRQQLQQQQQQPHHNYNQQRDCMSINDYSQKRKKYLERYAY